MNFVDCITFIAPCQHFVLTNCGIQILYLPSARMREMVIVVLCLLFCLSFYRCACRSVCRSVSHQDFSKTANF